MPSFLSSDLESGGDSVLIGTIVPTLPSSLIFPIFDQVHEGLAKRSEQRRLIICKHDRTKARTTTTQRDIVIGVSTDHSLNRIASYRFEGELVRAESTDRRVS